MVYAGAAAAATADKTEASLCFTGTLDPNLVKGKIVVSWVVGVVAAAASQLTAPTLA
jgi:hypothetical protein